MAGRQGLEPRFTGPEPVVLPLNDLPVGRGTRIIRDASRHGQPAHRPDHRPDHRRQPLSSRERRAQARRLLRCRLPDPYGRYGISNAFTRKHRHLRVRDARVRAVVPAAAAGRDPLGEDAPRRSPPRTRPGTARRRTFPEACRPAAPPRRAAPSTRRPPSARA